MGFKSFVLVLLFVVRGAFAQALPVPATATIIPFPGASAGGVAAGSAGSYGAASVAGVGMVALGALTVGMAIGYYGLEALVGDRFRVQVSDLSVSVPPAPVAQGTVDSVVSYGQYCTDGFCASSAGESCNIWGSGFGAQCLNGTMGTTSYTPIPGGGSVAGTCVHDWGCTSISRNVVGAGNPSVTCSAGYTFVSGTCQLTNARRASDDKSCDVLLNSGQFAVADDLNCPASASGSRLTPLIRGNSTYGYGTNSSGQPLMFEVSRLNNVIYIREYVQTSVNGQSQVQSYQATVNADTGVVTAVSGSVAPGSISAPSGSTGSVPTTAPAPDPITTPTVTQNTNQQPLQNIQFPTDYARTGEAQTAANTVRDKLQEFKETTDLAEVEPRADTDFQASFFAGVFDSLKAWQVPGHSSQCPTGSVSLWGNTYVMDSQCALMNQYFVEFQTVATVVWLLSALFIVLRA